MDVETVTREAHSIKGGALNVFANGLMQISKDLEINAKSVSLENAIELLEKIKIAYKRLKEFDGFGTQKTSSRKTRCLL